MSGVVAGSASQPKGDESAKVKLIDDVTEAVLREDTSDLLETVEVLDAACDGGERSHELVYGRYARPSRGMASMADRRNGLGMLMASGTVFTFYEWAR